MRYAASAEHGFEVFNSVPDASRYVQYSVPLYKAAPNTRGRIAYERGPNGQYKFISSGPDQRRSESNCSQYIVYRRKSIFCWSYSSVFAAALAGAKNRFPNSSIICFRIHRYDIGVGPDGVTRGAFSYLDDKGSQRSIQYIAGAGIGYRVVQDTIGPQSHLLPRPANVELGILYSRNRGVVANDLPSVPAGFEHKEDESALNGIDDHGSHDDDGGLGDFDWNHSRAGDIGPSSTQDPASYTIITNYGDKFFSIPPGTSVRAHVQNIDLKPFGGISLSPGEALRRDERRFGLRNSRYA